MEFEAVPEFLSTYENLTDQERENVVQLLGRLSAEHESRWARQGRIRRDRWAWILREGDWRMYWDYRTDSTILLLVLIHRARPLQ